MEQTTKTDLKNRTQEELKELFKEKGYPAFRGTQVFEWIQKGAKDFADMANLPKTLREELGTWAYIGGAKILTLQTSTDGTRKYLLEIEGGDAVEAVFMKYSYGNSLCISSQVGCRMGCRFCASTRNGLVRGLTGGEMVDQLLLVERDTGEPISHIVVMGIGEPFDNLEELSRFLTIVHDPKGRGLSYRNITVSTCGLVEEMAEFGDRFPQVNLAISLHAPNDKMRKEIMPIAERYTVAEVMEAARAHVAKTGRRITFEYALIEDFNDTEEAVRELCGLLRGLQCHVNLIPLNRVDESGYVGTERERVEEICDELNARGVTATIRRSLGQDIDAACGQLRLNKAAGK